MALLHEFLHVPETKNYKRANTLVKDKDEAQKTENADHTVVSPVPLAVALAKSELERQKREAKKGNKVLFYETPNLT